LAAGGQVVLKWGAITFGIGIALVILEIVFARRKKGGIQPHDRRRIMDIFWLAIVMSALVMSLIWYY
jgi:hypothetical protein